MGFLYVLRAEFVKSKGFYKRYVMDTFGFVASQILLFIGLFYTIFQNSTWNSHVFFQLLIGVFIWYMGISAVAQFSFILQEEREIGTLEQIYLTRTSLIKMLIGRAVSTFVFELISGIALIVIIFYILSIITSVPLDAFFQLHISLTALLFLLLLTMLGIYGFSFLLAGLALIFKRIGAFTITFHYLFLFFTGITLSDSKLPSFFGFISKFLPITWGCLNLKNMIMKSMNFQQIINSSAFSWLLVNTGIYIIIGLSFFLVAEKKARKNGTIGSY
ncbi:ABC transporter permease [Shimazuella kribbensis]|uniref:ABC transporter permease n=1 Tax=Shimazuella kribbensis TaxID=139808 RepID=UPI00041E6507|nr:ABC transporter permease [Shimazuella kribbensis]